tara:strand:- start:62 stop:496 length:435 start_codon:yes stop_codon:yes gene_type:complete
MIYLLYGQPASGKSTLGKLLAEHLKTQFVIDGDEFRGMLKNADFGFGGRKKNIRAANAVATYLNKKIKKAHIIMCLVSPYEQFRKELKEDNEGEVIQILLESDRQLRKQYHVEGFEDGTPDCVVNTDSTIEKTWQELKMVLDIN